MTKKFIIATVAVLSMISASVSAQVVAPQITVPAASAAPAAVASAVNSTIAAVLGAGAAIEASDMARLEQVLGTTRARRTTIQYLRNIEQLSKMDQDSLIGTAKVSDIKLANAGMVKLMSQVTDEELTSFLDVLNGELKRALDARAGNADDLETAQIIANMRKIAESSSAQSINQRVQAVLEVSLMELKDACKAKERG